MLSVAKHLGPPTQNAEQGRNRIVPKGGAIKCLSCSSKSDYISRPIGTIYAAGLSVYKAVVGLWLSQATPGSHIKGKTKYMVLNWHRCHEQHSTDFPTVKKESDIHYIQS